MHGISSHNALSFCKFRSLLLYFSKQLQRLILTLTPECDLDLEFWNINIMCNIPSNMIYYFVKFDKICSAGVKL